ncbi:hypothetical protein O1611_g2302 [Lasiodiplodia mahajangana]|uniref:Uncharacterized protein n=1 Tax=Lasiodiplodia mahajangana TaxID=1108764 RepID=A0ACC2JV95_9PEZI|nr:hypothetical protein O1611_g2302 [Lasiodiplodia mahajangana]
MLLGRIALGSKGGQKVATMGFRSEKDEIEEVPPPDKNADERQQREFLMPEKMNKTPKDDPQRRPAPLAALIKLRDDLEKACLVDPNDRGRKYIPISKQRELITLDTVLEIMWAIDMPMNGDDEKSVARKILPRPPWPNSTAVGMDSTSRRKLFAIVVLIGQPENILSFIREGIWDRHLPFWKDPITREWKCRDSSDGDRILRVPCFEDELWSPSSKSLFQMNQWLFLSPVFDMTGPKLMHYPLSPKVCLPFIEDSPNDGSPVEGGFGQSKDISYAVKRLNSRSKEEFDQEVGALSRFRDDGNIHLVKLLATYYDGQNYSLIFFWANGNLRDHWQRNPRPKQTYEAALWIAEQSFGIAEALRKIHYSEFLSLSDRGLITLYMRGRHGDIKPENILLFPSSKTNADVANTSQGVLTLSDFGLSRFHRVASANQEFASGLAVSPTYRAPEYDLNGQVSPSWDIWGLGCLYLEFVIWYLQGWEALQAFAIERDKCSSAIDRGKDGYFCCRRKSKFGACRKEAVVRRIEHLQNHPQCTEFIYELLHLIADGMMRIRSKKRLDCAAVANRMQKILEECKKRPSYCTEPRANAFLVTRTTNESDTKSGLGWASKLLGWARIPPYLQNPGTS